MNVLVYVGIVILPSATLWLVCALPSLCGKVAVRMRARRPHATSRPIERLAADLRRVDSALRNLPPGSTMVRRARHRAGLRRPAARGVPLSRRRRPPRRRARRPRPGTGTRAGPAGTAASGPDDPLNRPRRRATPWRALRRRRARSAPGSGHRTGPRGRPGAGCGCRCAVPRRPRGRGDPPDTAAGSAHGHAP